MGCILKAGWGAVSAGWGSLNLCALSPQSIVSKNALQFRGSSQHDAQEFLLWLLDRVHEDLHNLVKNSDGRAAVKVRPSALAQRSPVERTMGGQKMNGSIGLPWVVVRFAFLAGIIRGGLYAKGEADLPSVFVSPV